MSQADVETLRAVYAAVSRGDWDAAFREAHPDFELTTPDLSPIAGTYRGADAVRGFFAELWAAFDEVQATPEELIDLGDRVLVFLLVKLRPRDSEANVDLRVTHLWTMRNGKTAGCRVFNEREAALEAAGLMEQA
jgi:ketosteroid isomerase-like protein